VKSEFRPVRYLRKISFGGSLNLFVTPKGSRYWRYRYRYGGKSTRRYQLIVRAQDILQHDNCSLRV
jgi:hypothetical protein